MKKRIIFTLLLLISLTQVYAIESLDIKADLIEKEILPDDPIRFQVEVFRVGEQREDIYFEYFIITDKETKFIESESIAVEKIGSFFRTIELPGSISTGQNKLLVRATFRETQAETIETFQVVKASGYVELSTKYFNYVFVLLAIILIAFLVFMIWDYRLTYKLMKMHEKIGEEDV